MRTGGRAVGLLCAFATLALLTLASVSLGEETRSAPLSPTDALPSWAVGTGLVGGVFGGPLFAVWFSWYMTTRRVPAMERRYTEMLTAKDAQYAAAFEASEKRHADHMSSVVLDFRNDLKELWKYKREDDLRFLTAVEKLATCVDSLSQQIHGLSQKVDGLKRDRGSQDRDSDRP